MPVRLTVPRESASGERRVALDPATAQRLTALGLDIMVETEAGVRAGFPDAAYAPARIGSAPETYAGSELMLRVAPPTVDEVGQLPEGSVLVGVFHGHRHPEMVRALCERRILSFAMELIPRISRAQSMDVLSSQAAVAGYKAAIMGADLCPRFFPMLTTAAGTIRPSRVIVIGAGVAGLQAIATARRLGAMVEAYDVRSATREQVESLGARFLDLGVQAEGEGGYARELTEAERQQQQEALSAHIAKADVLITTASVPGRPAPQLIPETMVANMKAGAVIIDLAAEGGGNCSLTQPGTTVSHHGVTIHGPLNVASQVAVHASEMYAKNVFNFLSPMLREGRLEPDWDDEIVAQSCLTRDGAIVHAPTRQAVEGAAS